MKIDYRKAGIAVVALVLVLLLLKYWVVVLGILGYLLLAAVLGVGLNCAVDAMKSKYALVAGVVMFVLVSAGGIRDVIFHVQMHRLEQAYARAVATRGSDAVHDAGDYYGSLSEVCDRRDILLRRYWHRMDGDWHIGRDGQPRVSYGYYFSLLGWAGP